MPAQATAETGAESHTETTESPQTLGEYVDTAAEEYARKVDITEDIAKKEARQAVENNEFVQRIVGDERAQGTMMDRGVDLAVGVLVVGLLTAYLLPIAIDELVTVDTTSWGNAESSLFDLLPLFFVLAILLFVVAKAKSM